MTTPSPRTIDEGAIEVGASISYAADPLVLATPEGDSVGSVIGTLLTSNILAAYGVLPNLELGLDVPLHYTGGNEVSVSELTGTTGFGLGDIRLHAHGTLYEQGEIDGFALGMGLDLRAPTGSQENLQGGGFSVEPAILAEYRLPSGVAFAVRSGYAVREQSVLNDLEVGDALRWNIAGAAPVSEAVTLFAELFGETAIGVDDNDRGENPWEWLIGGRSVFGESFVVQGGFGRGLTAGYGAPDFRLVVRASYVIGSNPDRDADGILGADDLCPAEPELINGFQDDDGCPEPDSDMDGVPDDADNCPNDAEDPDGFEDNDGCPELDNDRDDIMDDVDECPAAAEDYDGFEDEDGCPELDNDDDGITDQFDECPGVAEDLDGFADGDGCPELDNDDDGVADLDDLCPSEPETLNAVDDFDGCPDVGLIEYVYNDIRLMSAIVFEPGTATIVPASFATLDAVIALMRSQLALQLMVNVGTRERTSDADNVALAAQRAGAVVSYLVNGGVAAGRIQAGGGTMQDASDPQETTVTLTVTSGR